MTPELITERLGGVCRTSDLAAAGLSLKSIGAAVNQGRLLRPRRGWVATRDAEQILVFAAERGALVTCITQAQRLGLWVMQQAEPHLAARSPHSRTTSVGCRLHWSRPLTPRHPSALSDSLENTLLTVAACQPYEYALAVWESALNKKLIDHHGLAALPLRGSAIQLLADSTPFSDSGLESILRHRTAWMKIPLTPQAWVHNRRVDFLLGARLVIQIDGGHHVGRQRGADNLHDAELLMRGYFVIRVGYSQVMHRWHEVQRLLMDAVARGLHLAPEVRSSR